MLSIKNKTLYKAFGLSINSEIPLSDLSPSESGEGTADIEVLIEDLSKPWIKMTDNQSQFVVKENLVMFKVPNLAIFAIQDGKRIIVSPAKNYEEDMMRLFILGTCMGALLMQKRILPLHGSAIAIDGKAYAIIGESGAGKSTLASAFLKRGYQLLTDDVIALSISKSSLPIITPSYPQQKLWQESLKEFGMEFSTYSKVYQRETKFAVPVPTQFYRDPLPLAGIFELVRSESESLDLIKIEGLDRLQTLFNNTYRNFLIPSLGLLEWHFNISTSIVSQTRMFQLQRPINSFTAHQLVSLILNCLNKEEK
ncbi:aldolase [Mesobacillus foraminis]|uniref:Aldolase n=1 Tax=Mesobacillus foraminis TaxID=279826 RepID=A0A4R2B5Y3_9BACI|nr:aldolase [Mesobacillus foraminis]TCN22177.1 hypothetical protein EV146_11113 [Mesobacillus foraminis]